jgi:hypothetical protein
MFYVSRWYDPSLGRFVQADTLIPESTQGTQAWDRYAFVNNNPVRYNDPTGHRVDCGIGESCYGNQTNPKDPPTGGKSGGSIGKPSTNKSNGDDAPPSCADAVGVEIMCIFLTGREGGQADVLEDQLDFCTLKNE